MPIRKIHPSRFPSLIGLSLVVIVQVTSQHEVLAQTNLRPLTGYVSPNALQFTAGRALLLPTVNQTDHKDFEVAFHNALETALRSTQIIHVVDCPTGACEDISPPQLCNGRIPLAQISTLRKRFGVEMIIATAITELHPYRHPKVGVDLHIIETNNAEVVASLSGTWDGRDRRIAEQARRYFQSQSRNGALCNTELVFQSPRYFTEYVTHDLAQSLARLWNPASEVVPLPEPTSRISRLLQWCHLKK